MNYLNIHNNFVSYCKSTSPRERLMKRCPSDWRLNDESLYTERHHIVPRHDGGSDDPENLIELLPEEHYWVHLIRYKAFDSRNDFLAVRYIINGLNGRNIKIVENNVSIKTKIGRFKHYIQFFRKRHGWHTEEGIKSISDARKNTMVVKDRDTGELVGAVNVDHENVLSGKWVHHTKGFITMINIETGKKERVKSGSYDKSKYKVITNVQGKNNPNYREHTEDLENLMFDCVKICSIDVDGIKYVSIKQVLKNINFKLKLKRPISRIYLLSKYESIDNFIDAYNSKRNDCVVHTTNNISKRILKEVYEKYNND